VNTRSKCLRWECAATSPSIHSISLRRTAMLTIGFLYNVIALGSGILFAYPEISTIAGVQGLVIYALSSSLPLMVFGFLGPVIRRRCPEGFVLTEWTRQRYGIITALYLSFLTYLCWAELPKHLVLSSSLGLLLCSSIWSPSSLPSSRL